MKVLIVGAGLAGLTAAAILGSRGHEVVIVERAARLRADGHAVDLWGSAVAVLDALGLGPGLRSAATRAETARTRLGRWTVTARLADYAAGVADAHVEVMRGDLVELLWAAAAPVSVLRLGASVEALATADARVEARFAGGARETFDLVVGADGVHSSVRRLAFGDGFEQPLDYVVGGFSTEGIGDASSLERRLEVDATAWSFPIAGRDRRGYGILARLDGAGTPSDLTAELWRAQRRLCWPDAALLDEGVSSADFYVDRVSQVSLPLWRTGRIVVVGDAAWSPGMALGGGASLAVAGAALLAREVDDGVAIAASLDRWEQALRPIGAASAGVAGPMGRALVPSSLLHAGLTMAALSLFEGLPRMVRRRVRLLPPAARRGLDAIARIPLALPARPARQDWSS